MTVVVSSPRLSRSDRVRSALWSTAFHAAISVIATFPLIWHVRTRLPLGTEPTGTVALFNLWTLRWGAEHLVPFGDRYWNAPIFAPATGTFAWSEPQPFTGAMFWLLRHLGGDVAGYNLVLILSLTLTGVLGARLARVLGAGTVAAAVVGVWFQLLPFVFDQLGVLQLVMVWPLVLMVTEFIIWTRDPELGPAVRFGLAAAIAILSCGNLALVAAFTMLIAAPVICSRRHPGAWPQRIGGLCVAVSIVIVTAVPVVFAQQQRLEGRRWSDATIRAGSATWGDWWIGGRAWPGVPIVVLAAWGAWRTRREPVTRYLLALALLGMLFSFGPRLPLIGPSGWGWWIEVMPAIGRLRSPWRAAAITQLALVALAVPVLVALIRGRRAVGVAVAAVLATVVLLGAGGPGRLLIAPTEDAVVVAALRSRPDGSPVVVVPFAPGPAASDFEPTAEAMLTLLDAGHPLVNGYSGFFPLDHSVLRDRLQGFPDSTSSAELRRRGVRYVVADLAWLGSWRDELDEQRITVVSVGSSSVLLELPV